MKSEDTNNITKSACIAVSKTDGSRHAIIHHLGSKEGQRSINNYNNPEAIEQLLDYLDELRLVALEMRAHAKKNTP